MVGKSNNWKVSSPEWIWFAFVWLAHGSSSLILLQAYLKLFDNVSIFIPHIFGMHERTILDAFRTITAPGDIFLQLVFLVLGKEYFLSSSICLLHTDAICSSFVDFILRNQILCFRSKELRINHDELFVLLFILLNIIC